MGNKSSSNAGQQTTHPTWGIKKATATDARDTFKKKAKRKNIKDRQRNLLYGGKNSAYSVSRL